MFSAPVRSGWKPEPNSSSAATRPLTAMRPCSGPAESGDEAQQSALAGAIAADDGHAFAALHLERDILESVEDFGFGGAPGETLFDVGAQQFGPAGDG